VAEQHTVSAQKLLDWVIEKSLKRDIPDCPVLVLQLREHKAHDQRRQLSLGGVPLVHQCWGESDGSAVKGDQGASVHPSLKRLQWHGAGVQ
jgi:hypothetical protein